MVYDKRRVLHCQCVIRILTNRHTVVYKRQMFRVEQTAEFAEWLDGLRDKRAVEKIAMRLVRIQSGLFGDWKTVGDGVSELRVDYGPGYRLYYALREQVVVILLCGSDKRDQKRAVKLAKELAKTV